MSFHVPNKYRIKDGPYGSPDELGNIGAFDIPFESYMFVVIASDKLGWEHVSISLPKRCPNWKEMCFMKDLFWDDEDTVVQYHPPKSEYVNNDTNCLHLWRPTEGTIPLPDSILVGIKKHGTT